jgi:hypothetical protein
MKYSDGSWQDLSTPGFIHASDIKLFVDQGIPYIAYQDSANGNQVSVIKYVDGSWQTLGNPVNANSITSFFVDQGIPYLSYTYGGAIGTYNGQAAMSKYIDGSWHNMGIPEFADDIQPLFVGGQGTSYVVYSDSANGNKTTVMKYINGSWQRMGNPDFISGGNFVVDQGILYEGCNNGKEAVLMKFDDGSRQVVGKPFPIDGTPNIFVDQGIPYVEYMDSAHGYKMTVMKYAP